MMRHPLYIATRFLMICTLVAIFGIIVMNMASCGKKETVGPQGEPGDPGTPGNYTAWYQDIDIWPADWTGPVNDAVFRTVSANQQINAGDLVAFYYEYQAGSWQPLPYTEDGITMTGRFSQTFTTIRIAPVASTPVIMTRFRMVVIPGAAGMRISNEEILDLISTMVDNK